MKQILKHTARGLSLAVMFPLAAASLFGRVKPLYITFAQTVALMPGLPGDYLRIAYYRLTLDDCSLSSRVSFGSFFSHPQARVAGGVYIGSYCVLGMVTIGERTQIASAVQVLSGARQHSRDGSGRITGAESGEFTPVSIGADCWIGAAAIVMADIGDKTTIGAGSVVNRAVPGGSVAVGSPARVIRTNT